MTVIEIKKIIASHNRYASNVLNTNYNTATNTVLDYKRFIEGQKDNFPFLAEIIDLSKTADDMFATEKWQHTTISTPDDEKERMPVYYKQIVHIAENVKDLGSYAYSIFFYESKFNNAIKRLFEVVVVSFIDYVKAKLEEIYLDLTDLENKERSSPQISAGGDVIVGSTVQKQISGDATIKDVGNDNSKKKFEVHKESFGLGFLSAVLSGVVVWGITELIKGLLS